MAGIEQLEIHSKVRRASQNWASPVLPRMVYHATGE